MDNRIIFSTQPVQPITSNKQTAVNTGSKTTSSKFQAVLDKQLVGDLRFSRHAQERLQSRNIKLSSDDLEKLNQAVSQAREKGSRDSLILMNDLALVVSVKNNTVVTAMDGVSMKDNVFTNIDSAVIV